MFQRTRRSLVARITAISLGLVALTLVLSGLALIGFYDASLERILDNHITAYADILIANIKRQDGGIVLDDSAALSRIPRYWQISIRGKSLYKSDRLKDWIRPLPEDLTLAQRFDAVDSDGVTINAVQATYLFPGDLPVTLIFGLDQKVSAAYLAQERGRLETPLLEILLAEGLLLIAFTYGLTRYAVGPLKAISAALRRIREGQDERIAGDHPAEIDELASEINRLLDYTSALVAKHREFSSNLAHSLKTPITVIRNETDLGVIREKTQGMLDIIERSLARARPVPSDNLLSARTPILPVLQDIGAGFGKLYGKAIDIDYPDYLIFKGDKADLYEILGNIVENACKFSRSTVSISDRDGVILIEDDGDGIPAAQRSAVLERGTRLDRAQSGTGIGLAVARDIVALYNGEIALDASALSGLKVSITLPLQR